MPCCTRPHTVSPGFIRECVCTTPGVRPRVCAVALGCLAAATPQGSRTRAGKAHDPRWALNLREHAEATVTVGREERPVLAREVTGAERERLWAEAKSGAAGI